MAMKTTGETPKTALEQTSRTMTTATPAVKSGFDHSVGIQQDHAAGAMAGFEKTQMEGKATMDKMIKSTEEAATSRFNQSVDAMQDGATSAMAGLEKTRTEAKGNMDKVMKSAEEMVSFSQGNVEAIVKSGQIWAAGVQDLSKAFAATAQAQMDAAMAAMKALSSVKSLKDAVELHTNATRNSVETVMAETGKLTDASMKLAEQAMAPIAARVTLAAEKFGRAA